MTSSTLSRDQANGSGANAEGGGIANVSSAMTTVSSGILILNEANGGGAAGLGGGAYNDSSSTLAFTQSLVTQNQADGGPGIGGGIYSLGTFTFDANTFIVFNHASTSGDNIGP